MVERVLNESGK